MKGILLAGGNGTRLWPLTNSINKHLLPIFDKPMIHYSLATLMLAGINQILIISSYQNLKLLKQHFGDGEQLGLSLEYAEQTSPIGIPNGISIAKDFIKKENFALILGDNVFHGSGLGKSLSQFQNSSGAKIFCANVANPKDFGVVEIFNNRIVSIVEKPISPRSKLAITGLYFFDSKAIKFASELEISARGEYEIVDLLKKYQNINELKYEILPRGTAWLDTGTSIGILEASQYVETIQKRQGLQIGCLEEIAWRNKWISDQALYDIAKQIPNLTYAKYLYELVEQV